MAEGLTARNAGLALLAEVLGEGRLLSQVLADPAGPLAGLPGPERARAQRLAAQVLRQIEPADRLLAPALRKQPPLAVMNILRLAVVELAGGAAAHGVVHTAVETTRRGNRTGHLAGLVNAVLRSVSAGAVLAGPMPDAPMLSGPVQRLPRWLRQPETGLMMVQGRAGATGERFNLGEVTVTRCALRLGATPDAAVATPVGVAYVLGRSHRQARLAATADALLQDPAHRDAVFAQLLQPVREHLSNLRSARLHKLQQSHLRCCILHGYPVRSKINIRIASLEILQVLRRM